MIRSCGANVANQESTVDNAVENLGIRPAESLASTERALRDHGLFGTIALIALSVLTCLVGLHEGPPMGDHECINALAARNAMQSGDWLIPIVNDAPLIRKMPLGTWLIGASSIVTGHPRGAPPVTLFSARLPSALAGIGTALVTAWLGSMLFGRGRGLIAGFICAGCAATVYFSRNSQVDMVLTFFTTLAFACFWRGAMHEQPSRWFMAWFYVAFALAMMAKAPLPLATVGLSLFTYWFIATPFLAATSGATQSSDGNLYRWLRELARQVSRVRTLWLLPGVAVFVVIVGAWPGYVSTQVDNALALWRIEYLSRFTGELSDKARPAWYYLQHIFGLTMPFMLSIPEAVVAPFLGRYAAQRKGLAFAFTWALVATAFLSASEFKRPHYLLSVIPAYCLLLAPVIDRLFFGVINVKARGTRIACRVLPILLAIAGIVGGVLIRQKYPALLTTYVIAFLAVFLVWTAACWAHTRDQRLSSFALLNLGVPVLVLVMWPALGKGAGLNAEADALAVAIHDHGIEPDRSLYWIDGQPSFSIQFYHGVKIKRLVNEIEMAGIRQGRRDVSEEVYQEIVRQVQKRLSEDPPVYFIVSAGGFDLLSRRTDFTVHEVFRLNGFHEDAEDELVVFTRGTRGD